MRRAAAPARRRAISPQAISVQPVSRSRARCRASLQPYELDSAATPTATPAAATGSSVNQRRKRGTGELTFGEEAVRRRASDARAVGRRVATRDQHDMGRVAHLRQSLGDGEPVEVRKLDVEQHLLCETFSEDGSLNGIHLISSSDGGDLREVTSNYPGGDDVPGSWSPDGKRIVFHRFGPNGDEGVFVVNVNGTGLKQILSP